MQPSASSPPADLIQHASVPRALLALAAIVALTVAGACTKSDAAASTPLTLERAAGKSRVRLVFGGDLSTARAIGSAIEKKGKGDVLWALAGVKDVLSSADLAFVNLECALADSDEGKAKGRSSLRGPTKTAAALARAGIDVASVANNHSLDFGLPGFTSTLRALNDAGVIPLGVQERKAQAQAPLVARVGTSTIALLAYNAIGDEYEHDDFRPRHYLFDRKQAVADIEAAKRAAQLVVVSLHWGPEQSYLLDDQQIEIAHALVDAGADVIVGHHAHVREPFEEYKGALILYNLGDLLFDKTGKWNRFRSSPRFLLQLDVENGERVDWRLLPYEMDAHLRPVPAQNVDVASWRLAPVTSAYDFTERLKDATVERVDASGAAARCATWAKTGPRLNAFQFRWLRPRFICDGEKQRAWLTVARTADLSRSTLRRGIWAHPHGSGPLRMTWPAVPLAKELVGYTGFTDWGASLAKAPARVRVLVDGAERAAIEVPAQPGWHELRVDTSALVARGTTTAEVTIEVEGPGPDENGFVVHLETR